MAAKVHPPIPFSLRFDAATGAWQIFDGRTRAINARGDYLDGGGYPELSVSTDGSGLPELGLSEASVDVIRLNHERGIFGTHVKIERPAPHTKGGESLGKSNDDLPLHRILWVIENGGFRFDGGEFIELTERTSKLLTVFVEHSRRETFGYDDLREAWDGDLGTSEDTIRGHISKLRMALRGLPGSPADPIPGRPGVWRFILPR